ncbi:hypothetical protein DFH07DRAFT_442452 [Mycena maculata]|uniref:Uncharacterized protein n=1 Tax=Mycena maculata TaxID=230809 RepID=A0AAD7J9J5_9AGAR|nr:hypothetical protein DFH07DRAFT_442452 [Mycena maculata]
MQWEALLESTEDLDNFYGDGNGSKDLCFIARLAQGTPWSTAGNQSCSTSSVGRKQGPQPAPPLSTSVMPSTMSKISRATARRRVEELPVKTRRTSFHRTLWINNHQGTVTSQSGHVGDAVIIPGAVDADVASVTIGPMLTRSSHLTICQIAYFNFTGFHGKIGVLNGVLDVENHVPTSCDIAPDGEGDGRESRPDCLASCDVTQKIT